MNDRRYDDAEVRWNLSEARDRIAYLESLVAELIPYADKVREFYSVQKHRTKEREAENVLARARSDAFVATFGERWVLREDYDTAMDLIDGANDAGLELEAERDAAIKERDEWRERYVAVLADRIANAIRERGKGET